MIFSEYITKGARNPDILYIICPNCGSIVKEFGLREEFTFMG